MAIKQSLIKSYLEDIGINFHEKDEDTIVFPYTGDEDSKIMVVCRIMEDGEYFKMHTIKHLDDLMDSVAEDKKNALKDWMLYENYKTKTGSWEYDPSDNDIHFSVEYPIEDGDLTKMQFTRGFAVVLKSADKIPEMKKVLGLVSDEMDEKERKRQELLRQLQELESGSGSI